MLVVTSEMNRLRAGSHGNVRQRPFLGTNMLTTRIKLPAQWQLPRKIGTGLPLAYSEDSVPGVVASDVTFCRCTVVLLSGRKPIEYSNVTIDLSFC